MMRPALQKLLLRPSSLDFLRFLVGKPGLDAPTRKTRQPMSQTTCKARQYSSVALVAEEMRDVELEEGYDTSTIRKLTPTSKVEYKSVVRNVPFKPKKSLREKLVEKQKNSYGLWDQRHWTSEELEFESNPEDPNPTRLLNLEEHKNDMELLSFLLDYRQKKYGDSAVSMFWDTIVQRGVQIHTKGFLADKLWSTFVELGFKDHHVLKQVCKYANDLAAMKDGSRWSKLYFNIIQHFLVKGFGTEALEWHDRLQDYHSPGNKRFLELCKRVTSKKGNLAALRTIYIQSNHHNVYSKVIPILCAQEDYKAALDWHFLFIENRDLPSSSKVVEPLIHFLAIYRPRQAVLLTRSLVQAGVPFAHVLSSKLNNNTKISREMMNLIHGKLFHVPVKAYNDKLGARWFATSWVSLDVAIHGIHALGVQEIGPLSLQALALREVDPKGVSLRIDQLKEIGISIGNSLFSLAVEKFARDENGDFLDGLLRSDQHPDELEDWKLQESLLAEYARTKDWPQYRRTLEIRSLCSRSPDVEKENLVLRSLLTRGKVAATQESLTQMQKDGTPVKSKTIAYVLRTILRPRQRGHRPMLVQGKENDTEQSIKFLQQIMNSGSHVPVTFWREIIRRLGMTGQWNELSQLCLELGAWYGPVSMLKLQHRRFRVPLQVPTRHPLHPLKIIFPVSLQKAIVEWGFIRALKGTPQHPLYRQKVITSKALARVEKRSPQTITSGITLLKQLSKLGVAIDGKSVRNAIFNRLVTYYGPGRSNRRYNRIAKSQMSLPLRETAKQIDEVLGGRYFTAKGLDISTLVEDSAKTRMGRIQRRRQRKLAAPRGEMGNLNSLNPVRRIEVGS